MIKKIFTLLVAILVFSMALATVHGIAKVEEKYTGSVKIESKEKVASFKITWNANGGKIGSKKTKVTSIKKGSKIGKLIATPKRSGYIFKGYYTKKSGGKKITKNTKPTKSVTYYAQWQKKRTSSNSGATESSEKKWKWKWVWDSVYKYNAITGTYGYVSEYVYKYVYE